MPNYKYKCSKCGFEFVETGRYEDSENRRCLKCGFKAKRLMGISGIIFKGPGFYVNDYKKKDKNNNKK